MGTFFCTRGFNDKPGQARGDIGTGEIVHRSPHATPGYWNDPVKTAESFRNGWFHSGDLGIIDDEGYLTVLDRKRDMIKTGGENVVRSKRSWMHTGPCWRSPLKRQLREQVTNQRVADPREEHHGPE